MKPIKIILTGSIGLSVILVSHLVMANASSNHSSSVSVNNIESVVANDSISDDRGFKWEVRQLVI